MPGQVRPRIPPRTARWAGVRFSLTKPVLSCSPENAQSCQYLASDTCARPPGKGEQRGGHRLVVVIADLARCRGQDHPGRCCESRSGGRACARAWAHGHEHRRNCGYGGIRRRAIVRHASARATLSQWSTPDCQDDARLIPLLVGFIDLDIGDVVLGSRIRSQREALACGMPSVKYLANRPDGGRDCGPSPEPRSFHSGFRVYARRVLETTTFEENANDFTFDSQFVAQAPHRRCRGSRPRSFPEASSLGLRRSIVYGVGTLGRLARYRRI